EGLTLPVVTCRRDALGGPTGVRLSLVNECGADCPGIGEQIALPGAITDCRGCVQNAGVGEGSKGIGEGVLVVDPATVNTMSLVNDVIESDQVLMEVERIGKGESEIVAWE